MNQPKSTGGLTSDMVTGLLTKVILNEALVNETESTIRHIWSKLARVNIANSVLRELYLVT